MIGAEEKQIEFLKTPDSEEEFAEYPNQVNLKINEIIEAVNKLVAKDNLSLEAINRLGTAHSVAEDMKHGCFLEFHNKRSNKNVKREPEEATRTTEIKETTK